MSCAKCATAVASINHLEGDDFIDIICANCSITGEIFYGRLLFTWAEVVHLALYHLTITTSPISIDDLGRKYYSRNDIAQLIMDNWDYLWAKPLVATWKTLLQTNLCGSDKFIRLDDTEKKKPNVWALTFLTVPRAERTSTSRRVVGEVSGMR